MNMQPLVHRLLVLSSCFALFACQKDISTAEQSPELSAAARKAASEQINTFKGPQVQMGDGKARSWISVNHKGEPQEIGIEMTHEAVMSMPLGDDAEMQLFLLPLHQKAQALTPFDHIVIDWNPGGHEPPGVFDVPHFDFHFYMMSVEDRLAIPPYPVDPSGFLQEPPAGYMPASYIPTPGGVPQMGRHWLDPTQLATAFTDIMIYGSYAGKVTFVEPMITLQELTSNSDHVAYAQPVLFQETGTWYPTVYNYYHTGDKYYVTLSSFVER